MWRRAGADLEAAGVRLRPGHRALLPDGVAPEAITEGPVAWMTGQEPTAAEAVLWAVGKVRPNTSWLPADVLDEDGFVRVEPTLQVPGRPEVFAIGDVAATDPLRSSARNRADKMLARNIRAHLRGRRLASYTPPRSRWGSVVGPQDGRLEVFAPTGQPFTIPAWPRLQPWIVRRGIYRGVRDRSRAARVPR
ncbi:FAD-dependent oxidoreductase [Nocardioides stalactiti]|uniref:FAD-dependent oxidoreductase n=1 Tax=Nocardioides stalactiti TaxID=2755356 RepID=UPI0028AEAA30|nr:FAD-dependent oxidoreductase [Nocardioides stalactiti]